MKKLFYAGLTGLALFEIANVYFIMPMPGSQRMDSLQLAYFLYTWRWVFRAVFGVLALAGASAAFGVEYRKQLVAPVAGTLAVGSIVWLFNFKMTADHMFREPTNPVYLGQAANKVDLDAVVIGVEHGGEARAYPIRYILYHHQVRDAVAGRAVMVTYCNVCRTGRVYEPVVNGQPERFRLVGMDHFNAMFEDATTRSWWRQVSGEAVTGPLKGTELPSLSFTQLTLRRWFELHPTGVVLQADAGTDSEHFKDTDRFERGDGKSDLTRTNRKSWEEKSWVLGVEVGAVSKAYDWNRLKKDHVINDEVGGVPLVVALAGDELTFVAFVRPDSEPFTLAGGVLTAGGQSYDFSGRNLANSEAPRLRGVRASQEFWHSWRTFHPQTSRDQ